MEQGEPPGERTGGALALRGGRWLPVGAVPRRGRPSRGECARRSLQLAERCSPFSGPSGGRLPCTTTQSWTAAPEAHSYGRSRWLSRMAGTPAGPAVAGPDLSEQLRRLERRIVELRGWILLLAALDVILFGLVLAVALR